MSNDLPPTHNPYGSQPEPPQYGAPQYGAPQYGAPGEGAYGAPAPYAAPVAYAHWGKRVGASLLDGLFTMLGLIPMLIGSAMMGASQQPVDPTTGMVGTSGEASPVGVALGFVGLVLYFVLWFWNRCWRQGRTGRSLGKSALGITLVKEATGQPVGVGLALGRELLHFLDGLFYIGYLWPLWDKKRQTFADKIVSTVVLDG